MNKTKPIGSQEQTPQSTKATRTPGLFKEEWSGDGIIGLCSKTHYCFGTSDIFSCKGVNKRCNDIDKDKYLNVFLTKQSNSGTKVSLSLEIICIRTIKFAKGFLLIKS